MKSLFVMKNRLAANCALTLVAVIALSVFASAEAQSYTRAHQFDDGTGGGVPQAGLLKKKGGGYFYGTTASGGDPLCHCGVVFKMDLEFGHRWVTKVLYRFTGIPDGAFPSGKLVEDAAGNLYGTTYAGGAFGMGTVFKLDPATGQETVRYSFTGAPDGQNPQAGLLMDPAGNLYGTTLNGGKCQYSQGCGVIFKVDTAGVETIVHTFTGYYDGAFPGYGALVQDNTGTLYGVSNMQGKFGAGLVFKMTLTNGFFKVLYNFNPYNGARDGGFPLGGLLRVHGDIYGTTTQGGTSGWGTVFKLVGRTETVLYNFTKGADGGYPQSDLVMDQTGNLYGTTLYGGDTADCLPYGCGTVFKLGPDKTEKVLHKFIEFDGANPWAGVTPQYPPSFSHVLGTTSYGGSGDFGVAFELVLR